MAVLEQDEPILEPVSPPAPEPGEQWRRGKKGEYVPRTDGRPGVIMRQGEETVEQARERDSRDTPRDKAPKRRAKPKMPPAASRKVDFKQLEETLADALRAPGAIAITFGDQWGFEHFNMSGPYLARQLMNASEYNPWLRKRLEEAATGEEAMMKVAGIAGIAGGLVMYLVPPTVYYLNLRVPEKAREMMHVPPRKENRPPYAGPPPSPLAGQPFAA